MYKSSQLKLNVIGVDIHLLDDTNDFVAYLDTYKMSSQVDG